MKTERLGSVFRQVHGAPPNDLNYVASRSPQTTSTPRVCARWIGCERGDMVLGAGAKTHDSAWENHTPSARPPLLPSSNQLIPVFETTTRTTGTIAHLARPARTAILPTSPEASQDLPPPLRERSATARLKTTTGCRRVPTSSAKEWIGHG